MDSYEHLQSMRDEAEHAAGNDASEGDLKRAAAIVENALAYLARDDINDVANGNIHLYSRGYDVHMDLAAVYSRLGDKEKALSTLEAMQHFAWIPAVGEATGGSTGQPLVFRLPGGGLERICVKRDVCADGREFVGKGIQPTIEVARTPEDFRAGRDAALARAVKELIGGR